MDPDATYDVLVDSIAAGDEDEAASAAIALAAWVASGGFLPEAIAPR